MLQNYPDESSASVTFICIGDKTQCVFQYSRTSLLTHSPLLRNLFSDPFLGLVQDPVILLPDFSEQQAASLAKLISWDWSESEQWRQSDIDLFTALGISVTADRVIDVSEQRDESIKNEVLPCDPVTVETIEDNDDQGENKARNLDIRCSAGPGCKFTTRGSLQKVTKGLKKHLGFAHFATELGLAAMETFDKDQCSFCGDLFLSSNKRMEHVLMKHDVLVESVDKLVKKMTKTSSQAKKKPRSNIPSLGNFEHDKEVRKMPVTIGNDTVTEDDVDQKEMKKVRNSKRTKKSSEKVVMVEEETEITETPKKENLTPRQGLVDEDILNEEDAEKYRANKEDSSSIRRSKRSRKRIREAIAAENNDVDASPSVKKCRVMLRSIKEENRTEKDVLIIPNDESKGDVEQISIDEKKSKTIDLESFEEMELTAESNETIKMNSKPSETFKQTFSSEIQATLNRVTIDLEEEESNQDKNSWKSETIAIEEASSVGETNQIEIQNHGKEIGFDDLIDSLLVDGQSSRSIESSLDEVLITEPSVTYPDVEEVGVKPELSEIREKVVSPIRMKDIKSTPLTPTNPPLIVENPMFETPREKTEMMSPNSTKKTSFVKLEMKRCAVNVSSVSQRTNNQIINSPSGTKEKQSSSQLTVSRREPAEIEIDKIVGVLQKTNELKLSASKTTKSSKNVKPENVEEEEDIIVDEIVNSPHSLQSEIGSENMTDIDHEIQRSLILDQDLSDEEDDDDANNEQITRFRDARESLMKELGVIEDDVVVC